MFVILGLILFVGVVLYYGMRALNQKENKEDQRLREIFEQYDNGRLARIEHTPSTKRSPISSTVGYGASNTDDFVLGSIIGYAVDEAIHSYSDSSSDTSLSTPDFSSDDSFSGGGGDSGGGGASADWGSSSSDGT